jgi:hypothetical protein
MSNEKNELIKEKNELIKEKNELIKEKNELIKEKNTPDSIDQSKHTEEEECYLY